MKRRKSAFTLIEIMIALTVFAIGILAVLRLITQNLISMDKAETRTLATFLAKEGIALTYNIRDANLEKWLPRNCLLTDQNLSSVFNTTDADNACVWSFSSWAIDHQVLQLGFASSWYYTAAPVSLQSSFLDNFRAFNLWVFTWPVGGKDISRYAPMNLSDTWNATIFARYIVFTWVKEWDTILPLQDILKVESHVLFIKGTLTGEIVLESMIGKW